MTPGERRRVEIGRSYKARKAGAVIRWHPKFCSAVPGEIPTPLNIRRQNRRGQAGLAKSRSSGYKPNIYSVFVHRLARLFRASFGPRLAAIALASSLGLHLHQVGQRTFTS